jgi:NADH:ubiquinone oxidoreductase subunit 6 (subunit J)
MTVLARTLTVLLIAMLLIVVGIALGPAFLVLLYIGAVALVIAAVMWLLEVHNARHGGTSLHP